MTVNPKEELLPCPFCGSHPNITEADKYIDGVINHIGFYIWCSKSGCIRFTNIFKEKETALRYWNKRTGGNNDRTEVA